MWEIGLSLVNCLSDVSEVGRDVVANSRLVKEPVRIGRFVSGHDFQSCRKLLKVRRGFSSELALFPQLLERESYAHPEPMKKKKPKPFRAAKAVKAVARDLIGAPPPTRAVPVKTKKAGEKHKPTLIELLEER
jgi:hypothetical protein